MAAELGSTDDPKALIPGDTAAVRATSEAMRRYGDSLAEAGDGLKRIDSSEGWQGEAAEQFRAAFDGEPTKWITAGDSFHHAAGALENYSQTLTWAQSQAAEAIRLWNEGEAATEQAQADHAQRVEQAQQHAQPGAPAPQIAFHDPGEAKRQAARAILDRARSQLSTAGDQAADVVGRARDTAPAERSWIAEAGEAIGDAAATAVNGLASFGNAALHHPELVVGAVGGVALTAVSSAAMAGGVVLDATGAGAVVGAPVNYVAGAGMVAGGAMVAASVGGLGAEAAGDDSVEAIDASDAEPAPAPELPWEDPAVQEKLPEEWGDGNATKKGVGQRWQDPNDPGSGVRIDQGNPNNSQPTQQVDHVIVRDQGKVIGRDGEPISGSVKQDPENAHIPLSEWKQWKSWNHP
ncbi:putative T7SS-secreted protein [Saccharopolyspora sp. NPDC049426]|uniref:putative T7SS-secreted protein n=1 Tax=Saccharopolyspora sp. NPDC049426 TaxID=3155652 RepID=UPI00342059EB